MSADPDPRTCILIVEDDVASAEMLTMMLEDEGYHARVAATAKSAIDLLEALHHADAHTASAEVSWRPDLLLLDLQLPDRDGTAIIKHFRDSSRPVPPVIVLSAKRVAAVEEAALMIRAAGVVHKPFDMDTLLGSIATVLAQSASPSLFDVSDERNEPHPQPLP